MLHRALPLVLVGSLLSFLACAPRHTLLGGAANDPLPLCPSGLDTSIAGYVTMPNGRDPVPNALVYIPSSGQIPELPQDVTCDLCTQPGEEKQQPAATARTGADGRFVLRGAPAGQAVPIIVQQGHFRRVLHQDVVACQRYELAREQTRLPRSQKEGDLPRIALAAGDFDAVECVLRRMGVADEEFTAPDQGGSVHFYDNRGHVGPPLPGNRSVRDLLDGRTRLEPYHMVFFGCSDSRAAPALLAQAAVRDRLASYVARGGRLYVTDWSYDWLGQIESFAPALCFRDDQPCTVQTPHGMGTAFQDGRGQPDDSVLATIDRTTAAGKVLDSWLADRADYQQKRQFTIDDLLPSWVLIQEINPRLPVHTWVNGAILNRWRPLAVSFTHPPQAACGQVLFSSYHAREPIGALVFPSYCSTGPLTEQERTLMYLLFALGDCVQEIG